MEENELNKKLWEDELERDWGKIFMPSLQEIAGKIAEAIILNGIMHDNLDRQSRKIFIREALQEIVFLITEKSQTDGGKKGS